MTSEWKTYKIKDVLSYVVDNRGKTPPVQDEGFELLEVNAISATEKFPQYQVVRKHVSEHVYNTWFRSGHPQIGDILVPTVGTLGAVSYMNKDNCCIAQNLIALRANKDICDCDYLYYILRNPNTRKRLLNLNIGGVQPSIKVPHLMELEISLPDIGTQKKISSILKTIDDKISTNQKINDNLQWQAFALFDKLLSGEHLEVCSLSEIAELNPKRSLTKNEMARCIDMAQLSTSGSFPNGWEIKPYNGGMRFANGDTLLARITPCLENGKTAYIDFLDADEIAFGSTEYVVMCSQGQYPSEFFYCLARYPSFVDYAVKNMNGSSGRQRVSAETIGKYILPRLTDDELAEFRDVVPALFSAMRLNSLENINLSELRDALLQKLMSGEIDVSDIQL
ncbi:MAG: hypothetical protein E7607_01260 [Ruminococcaceae bacterium]|nr:hypothetical protein [Oscillospiraceae bacterium]